jgi:hypothetical protein
LNQRQNQDLKIIQHIDKTVSTTPRMAAMIQSTMNHLDVKWTRQARKKFRVNDIGVAAKNRGDGPTTRLAWPGC